MRSQDHARQQGFTLIEVMVACVLLLGGMAATLGLLSQAGATTVKTRSREQGTNLQRELVEAARSVVYDRLTVSNIGPAIRARPALADSSVTSAGWTITRRGTTYTVSMGVCTVDDPGDGTGSHDAGVFCASSAQQPTAAQCASTISLLVNGGDISANANASSCGIDVNGDGTVDGLVSLTATTCLTSASACSTPPDQNPADYKRVVSLVRWKGGYNLQTTQINNPGRAAAPSITSLTPSTASVTDPMQTSVSLSAVATNSPTTVGLYLDGTYLGPATAGSAGTWTGSWSLGSVTPVQVEPLVAKPADGEVLDGSYQVSAKAFDRYGQYGAIKTQAVVVNRRQAFAPARVAAGRNGTAAEIEWSPARERDSEGFRVDRRVGTTDAWTTVCARAVTTRCRDAAPPPAPAGATADTGVQYSVVGYDRDASGALRAGDRSAVVSVDPSDPVPGAPTALQAASGTDVTLTWAAPTSGVVPDHYNIYRDGSGYANRFDAAYFKAGDALSYTDTKTAGQPHSYWITAVNGQLGESPLVGPVP